MANIEELKDENGLPLKVDEGESAVIETRFKDPVENQVFKKDGIDTLSLTILNKDDFEPIVEALNIKDLNGGTLTTEGLLTLVVPAAYNTMISSSKEEETHIFIISFTYFDTAGTEQTGIQKLSYVVTRTPESTDSVLAEAASELDLTGVKRVKTKHMEIEAFDPRVIQDAREKQDNPIPSFCDLIFCKGKRV